jgi:hypothetical protein
MLFANSYLNTRNNYVIPLIPYGIKKAKCEHWILKDVLSNQLSSINHINNSTFDIEISKEIFFKSLVCEIELFLSKSIIQLVNCYKSNDQSSLLAVCNQLLSLVLLHHNSFRFLHKGFRFSFKQY